MDPETNALRAAIERLPDTPEKRDALDALAAVEAMCERRSKLASRIQALLDEMSEALTSVKDELELVTAERDLLKKSGE